MRDRAAPMSVWMDARLWHSNLTVSAVAVVGETLTSTLDKHASKCFRTSRWAQGRLE